MRAGALALVTLIGCDTGNGDGAPDAPLPPMTEDPCNGLDDDSDAAVDEDGCPAQCTGFAHENHTYVLCAGALRYSEAMAVCSSIKASLVRIDDDGENGWLRERVNERGVATKSLWVGGSDVLVEGEWRWSDGGLFWQGNQTGSGTGLYQRWSSGEPSDGGNEDCLLVGTDATWHAHSCDDPNPFICDPPDGPR